MAPWYCGWCCLDVTNSYRFLDTQRSQRKNKSVFWTSLDTKRIPETMLSNRSVERVLTLPRLLSLTTEMTKSNISGPIHTVRQEEEEKQMMMSCRVKAALKTEQRSAIAGVFIVVTDTDPCNPHTVVGSSVESITTKIDSPGDCGWFVCLIYARCLRSTSDHTARIGFDHDSEYYWNKSLSLQTLRKANALLLVNMQPTKDFLPPLIRSTCVPRTTACNQPQGADGILPARDGDALHCNGCSTRLPKSPTSLD